MSRRFGSSKQSERSKNERRTQETERESGGDVDVSPDELSINAGAVEIGLNTEGELSLGIEIPTPVPGVTATGGIVIDTETGEIEEVSIGAEVGQVTGFEVTIRGCNVITTFYVEIPRTNIRFSYDVISELPNCKIEENDEGNGTGEIDLNNPNGVDPNLYPPSGWNPIDSKFSQCTTTLYYRFSYTAMRCLFFDDTGYTFAFSTYSGPIAELPPSNNPNVYNSGGGALQQYFYPDFLGYGVPNLLHEQAAQIWTIKPDGSRINSPFERNYSDFRFDPKSGASYLVAQPPYANSEQNACNTPLQYLSARTGKIAPVTIVGISMSCPFPIENPPTIDDLNKPPGSSQPEKENPKPQPPKKMDKCCRESLTLLDEIHEALGVAELLDRKSKTGGFEVPKRLLAPGGRGEIKHHNYLEILESMIRIQDHLGIHPFQVKIKDLNAAVAGDQGAEFKFLSATAALEKIVYLLTDTEADGDVQTNMLVRLAFVCTNILTALSTVSRDVETVRDGLGVGFKSKRERVDVPFDVSCGQTDTGGFDPKKKKQIDLNEEDSTEALLPYLLRTKNHWIRTTEFDDKDDIKDLLIKILYSLKGRT